MNAVIPVESSVEVFPRQDYPADLQPDGISHKVLEGAPIPIPLNAASVSVRFDRSTFPDDKDLHLKGRILWSKDGQKWDLIVAFTTRGGTFLDDNGVPLTETTVNFNLPQVSNALLSVQLIPLKPIKTGVVVSFK